MKYKEKKIINCSAWWLTFQLMNCVVNDIHDILWKTGHNRNIIYPFPRFYLNIKYTNFTIKTNNNTNFTKNDSRYFSISQVYFLVFFILNIYRPSAVLWVNQKQKSKLKKNKHNFLCFIYNKRKLKLNILHKKSYVKINVSYQQCFYHCFYIVCLYLLSQSKI